MAQLWGGRFTKDTDALVYAFNRSLDFDKRLFEQDIRGSIAHVSMLAKQNILTEKERDQIIDGLEGIREDINQNVIKVEGDAEDIHSFVEALLTERIGEVGKKLHTGRSRNDQVALDMRLYVRDEIDDTRKLLLKLLGTIHQIMDSNLKTPMPGFTHMQKAQPVTLAHHFGAYFEMFRRDFERIASVRERMNVCPLGSCALAGTTYKLDREYTAKILGFDAACDNSMDGVSDRDYIIEFLDALSLIMVHLSRLSEEIITWNSDEYRFIELDDSYATGSSIMPQKKNPDIAELIRGKTGRVFGALMSMLTVMKGIPLAYNKDMQEDKEHTFDAIDTTKGCIVLMTGMLGSMTFNTDRMKTSATGGFTNATDVADYLVRKGMPFRDAHEVAGKLVLDCIAKNCSLEDLSLSEFKAESPLFDEDIYDDISLESCIASRCCKGAPGAVEQETWVAGEFLQRNSKR